MKFSAQITIPKLKLENIDSLDKNRLITEEEIDKASKLSHLNENFYFHLERMINFNKDSEFLKFLRTQINEMENYIR